MKKNYVLIATVMVVVWICMLYGKQVSKKDNEKTYDTKINIEQIDISMPYVFSEESFAINGKYVGTKDEILSYPVYHTKYGSYFLGKKTEESYIVNDVLYVGIEMEDSVIRYFKKKIINDGFGFNVRYTDDPKNYIWEEIYFKGCVTEENQIDTVLELRTLRDTNSIEPTVINFWEENFYWEDSEEILLLKCEHEILEYLQMQTQFAGNKYVTSPFGKRALFDQNKQCYYIVYGKKQKSVNEYKNIVEIYELSYENTNKSDFIKIIRNKMCEINLINGEIKFME